LTATIGSEIHRLLSELPYGKRLPGAVYLHRETCACRTGPLGDLVTRVAGGCGIGSEFNIIKFRTDAPRLSFLSYPMFFDEPHPALERGIAIDLSTGKTYATDYRDSLNPPILHRKELFLEAGHPRASEFAALSRAEEAAGLYQQTATIGFRLNWKRLLDEHGVEFEGHTIRLTGNGVAVRRQGPTEIHRHKTAITRYEVSKPVKTVLEYSLLREGDSFFDYGCGRGADVRALRELGYASSGWDPVHAALTDRTEADVVNLGYVLNVIEDPSERIETLVRAWTLTRRLLVVSSLIGNGANDSATSFGDGVLTTRNTFQKYFGQKELQQYIEDALEQPAVPAAMGVFYVFRDSSAHQEFLQSRSRRSVDWGSLRILPQRPERRLAVPRPPRPSLYEDNEDLLLEYWSAVLSLGRPPEMGEFARELEITARIGSPKRALKILLAKQGAELFRQAESRRKNDLLVYLGVSNLRKPIPFGTLPEIARRDIKAFFGSYATGLSAGRALLLSAADPATVTLACDDAGVGWQDDQSLYIHPGLIENMPGVLRIYVACAELLYGDAMQADIVKIHKASGKVTFLEFLEFDAPLPQLLTRTKVTLGTGTLDTFSHQGEGQLLCFKERFLGPAAAEHPDTARTSAILRELGISADQFQGPTSKDLKILLSGTGKSGLLPLLFPQDMGLPL
jgi:DNA phosphorothioation-associated putative methyltransferase